jgi:ATP-dependent DNA helicase DinG
MGRDLEARALELLGEITNQIPGGQVRDGQRLMVEAVARTLEHGGVLMADAGTGTGKSLGYLIPAAVSGKRIVVATATKALQDQLATKDAPVVAGCTGVEVAVLKGRQNYLCAQRWAANSTAIAASDRDVLEAWLATSEMGDRDEMGEPVSDTTWRRVSMTPQECLGRDACPFAEQCFAERAKDRALEADLVVTNMHLYAAHLATGKNLLGEHDAVVFDEAHELADILTEFLGARVSARAVALLVSDVARFVDDDVVCEALASSASRLEDVLAEERGDYPDDEVIDLLTTLYVNFEHAGAALSGSASGSAAVAQVTKSLADMLEALSRALAPKSSELVYLSHGPYPAVVVALIEVGDYLASELWPNVTGVLTSATMPANLATQLGLPAHAERVEVASPFDYPKQAILYVPADLPARKDPRAESVIVEHLVELIELAEGRTLALFTNKQVMVRVAALVAQRVRTPVLVQGELPKAALTEAFKADPSASLFAVATFWQGIDVPGHSLSVVAIDRLPFNPPGDPVNEARKERSANPFYEVELPQVAAQLAQGVGRLIRSSGDRGVVAVLDERLATASYRNEVLDSLPPMRRTRSGQVVAEFLAEVLAEHR